MTLSIDTSNTVDVTALADDIALLAEARDQIKAWEELEAGAKARLSAAIGEGVGTIDGTPVVAVTPHERKGFSARSFKSAYPALYAEFETTTKYRTVKVLNVL